VSQAFPSAFANDPDDVNEPPASRVVPRRPNVRQIFEKHAPFVWRSLRYLRVPESDIEDVCQEIFVIVHRKLGQFEGRSAITTWLYGICLRVAKDYHRRAYVRYEVAIEDMPTRSQPPSQERDYQQVEARRLLNAMLDELDEDKRAVIVLYEIAGVPMQDVAKAVGCPLQTAYSRLHTARSLLLEAAKRREVAARMRSSLR
jgi:RNA polymerase sigma-70 factor (ECF subfamily)